MPDHILMKKIKEVLFTSFIENISLFYIIGMVDEPKGRIKVIIYLCYPRSSLEQAKNPRLKILQTDLR